MSTWRSRSAAGTILVAGLLSAGAVRAEAQGTSADSRWQPWIGCWQTIDTPREANDSTAPVTCVIPAGTPSAVDIATVVDGKLVSRDRIDADGAQRASTKDGCTGWERAQWAADGRRVFLSSNYSCPGGLDRASSGVVALSAGGEWLDVQGITAGGNTGVQVVRYEPVTAPASLPREIAAAVAQATPARSLAQAARTAAAAPIDTRDVTEAVGIVEPVVVQAWLTERRQGFQLDAKELVALSKAGVPGGVIDVMVALSYPTRFAVAPTATQPGQPHVIQSPEDRPLRRPSVGLSTYDDLRYGYSPYGYSRYGYQYGRSRLDYGFSPYGYGYSPYGYGYSPYGGSYGWYSGAGPVVIIRDPNTGGSSGASNGRVVNGRGYTRGEQASGSGRTASPRSPSIDTDTRARTNEASSSRGGSSSGSSSSGSSSSGGGGEGSGATRTAKPRTP
jgi:hypothetical protein